MTFHGLSILVASGMIACATRAAVQPAVDLPAQPFPLEYVRLLDSPFRDAMLRDGNYLLSLDCDRLLFNFRVNAQLATDAKPYGGWEAPSCELRGHIVGHYLSACSLMYASTGDTRFKERVDKIVAGLAECQNALATNGSHAGYLSAFPESFIDRVENRQPVWAPWYTLHKIMAGLLDANQLCGSAQALEVLTNMADWAKFRVDRLPPAQMQRSLETEQGGMTEVLANLYGVTGNTNYLQLAEAFNHQRLLGPLERGEDRLNGLHANTQIPKIIGIAREYEFTGNPQFLTAANTFWNAVALDRSYVIGGDSDREHFFPTNAFDSHLSAETAETCNTYNMLKLTRHIFEWQPSAVTMDFYERALYNDILASQDPDTGMFTYFMSLKPDHFKTYSTPENSFWCCVGTGMENHAKYGDTIYFHGANSLFVNLFISSELSWPEKKLLVRQETKFPESNTMQLSFNCGQPTRLALEIRWPKWSEKMSVRVNGLKRQIFGAPGSYVSIKREWQNGDQVEIQLAMKLHAEPLPGATNTVAVLYGPIVLAGDLGTNGMPRPYAVNQSDLVRVPDPTVPVFVVGPKTFLKKIRPTAQPLVFETKNLVRPGDVTLIPFYLANDERYTVYWKLLSEAGWRAQAAQMAAADTQRMAEEARAVDMVYPGEPQSETDHKMQGDNTQTGDFYGRKWRDAAGWFSYEVKVLSGEPQQLVATYWGSDAGRREFDVLVDGKIIATQKLDNNQPGDFFDAAYPLPPELTKGKQSVTVRFAAHPDSLAGGLFNLRVLRAK
ncbi:MAG TPA: beta-L-arabinofuranosidase domain-containing protein [Candidatus Limnocylindrales bacterium]|nr:beta-L-arabinofuranosidase domain-containing protein [Candidatus Limnocylindrales bacterium]